MCEYTLRSSRKLAGRAITPQIIKNQRAWKYSKPSIHYRASLLPPPTAPQWCLSVLISSPFISYTEDSRFLLTFHINILSRRTHSWSKLTQLHWADAGSHQLHFWTEKGQHRSLLVQASRVCPLVNLPNGPSSQATPQRLEIPLWGHSHWCHLPCTFLLGGGWTQK